MKVFITDVMNGWLVRYQVFDDDDRLIGEKEKAFTYVLENKKKKEDAWRRCEWFIAAKLIDWYWHKDLYLLEYDEENEEWVSRQEMERRRSEKSELKRLKEFDATHKPANPHDFTRREIREDKRTFKKWNEEHASSLTPETWKIECMESTFHYLLSHFEKNDSMSYSEYEEIKNDAVRQFTKQYGLQPKEN